MASVLQASALEECIQEDGCGGASAGPRSAKKPKVSQAETARLLPLLDRFAAALVTLSDAAHALTGAKEELVSNTTACADVFNNAVDGWLVRLEEYRRTSLSRVQLLTHEREKALEAQEALLEVSAGQLAACVKLGRAAVASEDEERVCEAAETAKAMEGLLAVPSRVCTDTRLAVLCHLPSVWTSVEETTRLQRFQVNAARCVVSGVGLVAFVRDEAARNVIDVRCAGMEGKLAVWATVADADVAVTLDGAPVQVASAEVVYPGGTVRVTYAVEEGGPEEVAVGVSVRGVTVPGGPWRARHGFMARGNHVTTLALGNGHDNAGLAVSSDGRFMVVCNRAMHQVSVYRAEGGRHVRSFGCRGTGPGEFHSPTGLCMTARDTVLVAEWRNERIQEVTLEGKHVRFFQVGNVGNATGVALHGDVMAVSTHDCSIGLYSYVTGALIRHLQLPSGELWSNVSFAPDGDCLLGTRACGSMAGVSLQGKPMGHLDGHWEALAYTATGDVVGLQRTRVRIICLGTDHTVRDWDIPGTQFTHASALAVSRNRLYVLDAFGTRVQVFE